MPGSQSSSRMEAFSDGVFSIAATLLVFDIALNPPGTPLDQVLNAWPAYLGYLVSFLTIGAAWLGHSALTDRLTRVDALMLRINLLLLLVVAFLPFPTRLVSGALDNGSGERLFVTMYGLTLVAIRALGYALDEYASREHLYTDDSESRESRMENRKLLSVLSALRGRDSRRPSSADTRGRVLLRHCGVFGRPVSRGRTPIFPPLITACHTG